MKISNNLKILNNEKNIIEIDLNKFILWKHQFQTTIVENPNKIIQIIKNTFRIVTLIKF